MALTIAYAVVWALLIIPVASWARLNLRQDREYEGDDLDPISPEAAAAFGLIWAALWPIGVVVALGYGILKLIGLAMPEAD